MPDEAEVKKEAPKPPVEEGQDAVAQLEKEAKPPRVVKSKVMPAVSGGQIKPGDEQVHEDEEVPPTKGPILTCPKCGNLTSRVGKKASCICGFTAVEE